MAKKPTEVNKFGGVENLGTIQEYGVTDAPVSDFATDLQSLEVKSKVKLEDDTGDGNAAVVRMFEFGINPVAFKQCQPTKQQLFNSHYKGIEVALWKDGLKVIPEVNPKIVVDEKAGRYKIFVGAQPMRGHILRERPQTLTQIAHG